MQRRRDLAGRVPILVCVRGASIGFAGRKTAGRAKEQPDTTTERRYIYEPDTYRRR